MARDGTIEVAGTLTGELQAAQSLSGTLSIPTERITPGDYDTLLNKPSIENHTLIGNSTIDEIGVGTLTVQEIEKILYLD